MEEAKEASPVPVKKELFSSPDEAGLESSLLSWQASLSQAHRPAMTSS